VSIVVRTPARLHLGILDINGNLGRMYGSIGVAIERPNVVLEAEPADHLHVEGPGAERVAVFARRFLDRYHLPGGARLNVKRGIPAHIGLGSGTQLALAVGTVLARLGGMGRSAAEIAVAMGRGAHSGIGIAAFQSGGFVLDAGHRVGGDDHEAHAEDAPWPRDAGKGVPPVLFQHPFPEDWEFVVVVPGLGAGLNGEWEARAFQTLPQAPPQLVERISRLLLMKMLPALLERDIVFFGQALTEIQQLVGDSFAAIQGNRFANPLLGQTIGYLLDKGAAGAGQSSWGPTVYGLVEGRGQAQQLEREAQEYLERHGGGQAFRARADNRGARVWQTSMQNVQVGRSRRAS
jgi:beta-ribofuranosylaminobenzene 5'-phosphate synthase